jgi:hypothetical protein
MIKSALDCHPDRTESASEVEGSTRSDSARTAWVPGRNRFAAIPRRPTHARLARDDTPGQFAEQMYAIFHSPHQA